jgi:hypothetical protein
LNQTIFLRENVGHIDEAPPPEFPGRKHHLRELKLSLMVADKPWRISPSDLSLLLQSLKFGA